MDGRVPLTALEAHVWKSLSFRQRLAGRAVVNRIVRRTASRWPLQPSDASVESLSKEVEKKEVGMGILLTFVVGALVREIVRIIFDWWKESHKNQALMEAYQR